MYPHWSELPEDYLSYERWLQIIEVLKREKAYERYEKLELVSLINWTAVQLNVVKLKTKNFQEFLKKQGILHPFRKRAKSKKEEIDKAYEGLKEFLPESFINVFRRLQPKR